MTLDEDDPVTVTLVQAVRGGDLPTLERLLSGSPDLASARLARPGKTRTPLHLATDWPAYFPEGPAVTRMLLHAGADPDARTEGGTAPETPLHWAASSDDVDVAEVLIGGGADIEAPGASIGTPLGNAVGYGCWHVARKLVEHGARVDTLWQAAALGMLSRVRELLAGSPPPGQEEITEAFWQACHGGQRRAAEYLLHRGADINGIPGYAQQTPLDIAPGPDTRRELLVSWLRDQGAASREAAK
ncbi:MAG: ankyrin repeat domain-containing protein [Streptosporangiaceae bacterium]